MFVSGKGRKKPELQLLYEELEDCGKRLMEYKDCFGIMGKDRNSYSKTDQGGNKINDALDKESFWKRLSAEWTAVMN